MARNKLKWHSSKEEILDRHVIRDGKTALFAATTWARLINPFVPMDTGFLANDSVSIRARGKTGLIHYKAPYAVFNYYGEGKNFSTSKHSLASARWDVAAKRAGKLETLIKDVNAYVRRG